MNPEPSLATGSIPSVPPTGKPATGGVLSPQYRWVTIGMCAMIFLAAFESLAVTTVMPGIALELKGEHLYALSFAGPIAVSVVGMVLAGTWSDRRGPSGALYASAALFVAGLLIAGTAPTMEQLIVGRLLHGFGGGAMIVAIYVIVARVFPSSLQPRIFAGFAAAWVIPSLIGPLIAGFVADSLGWHWVFLSVVLLVIPALVMVVPAMKSVGGTAVDDRASTARDAAPSDDQTDSAKPTGNVARVLWSVLAAVAVLALNLSSSAPGFWQWLIPIVSIAVLGLAVRPLLPVGTLRMLRGLPAVVLLRGLIAGAFIGTEIYIPFLLTDQHGLSAAMAGLALSAGGVSWGLASQVQGRLSATLTHQRCFQIGHSLFAVAVILSLATAAFDLHPAVIIVGWAFGGAGMGMMYPRTAVMALEASVPGNQGFISSSIQISDAIGSAVAVALTGIVFLALTPLGGAWPFLGCFVVAAAIWLFSILVSTRARV